MQQVTIRRRIMNRRNKSLLGFVLSNNKEVSRTEAVRMASRNQIRNVRKVYNSLHGWHLQSTTDRAIYDLPAVMRSERV